MIKWWELVFGFANENSKTTQQSYKLTKILLFSLYDYSDYLTLIWPGAQIYVKNTTHLYHI